MPQLTSRVDDINKANLLEDITEKPNQMSRTLSKMKGTGHNISDVFGSTSFGGLKYKNPFKTGKNTERLEIPE